MTQQVRGKVTDSADDVHVRDIHSNSVGVYFATRPATRLLTTNDSRINSGENIISVVSTTNASIGDQILITGNGVCSGLFLDIVAIDPGVSITVNCPIDNDYPVGATIEGWDIGLSNHVGTLSSPVSYTVGPKTNEIWDIHRLLITFLTVTVPSDQDFGDLPKLPNGMVLRKRSGSTLRTSTIWRSNANMIVDMFDFPSSPKKSEGTYGIRGRWTLDRNDFVHTLDGSLNEVLEILNQDDITGLAQLHIKAWGHVQ